ncbi:MAG: shikimate kinase [Pyrinomonadaceae bacterium]|nr:shikimate kinase [Blastocatellia bacterium]MDQ3491532.1 shikimate kinase [Acidobacteriota bacterium]
MNCEKRIALTGFMGVGKSSVARHLSYLLRCQKIDLDTLIEVSEHRRIAEIINADGEAVFRRIETENLKRALNKTDVRILSLGGGTWTMAENRDLIREHGMTSVWLESNFNHCWNNIRFSRKERPLARNKSSARKLFDARQELYCLADWHFIVKPDLTSFDIARQIAEEVFS